MFCQGNVSFIDGATCLEIGSGAGRFTDYLVELCQTVVTVDSSPAIFCNAALGAANLIACRADLFDIPIRRDQVDIVFCRGVIQHTPDPKRAIEKLFDYVRPGGIVLFDVYPFKWYTPLVAKYWLRPLFRMVRPETITVWIERLLPGLLNFKHNVINRILPRNKFGEFLSNQLVPVADALPSTELRSWEHKIRWSVLDTVDMYTPRYDHPLSFDSIMQTLKKLNTKNVQANPSTFCFKAVAQRRNDRVD